MICQIMYKTHRNWNVKNSNMTYNEMMIRLEKKKNNNLTIHSLKIFLIIIYHYRYFNHKNVI